MSVTKSTIEKWHIRRPNGWWCGNFLFDNINGELCIHSDWGNWAFRWGSMGEGMDLKKFIVSCNTGYLMSKFANPSEIDWFDFDATIKELKKEVLKLRRNSDLDEEPARDCWSEIADFDEVNSAAHYWEKFYSTSHLKGLYYDHYAIPCVTDYHPRLRAFMREGWPLFISAIKEELCLVA
jgi:hypothetical protein